MVEEICNLNIQTCILSETAFQWRPDVVPYAAGICDSSVIMFVNFRYHRVRFVENISEMKTIQHMEWAVPADRSLSIWQWSECGPRTLNAVVGNTMLCMVAVACR